MPQYYLLSYQERLLSSVDGLLRLTGAEISGLDVEAEFEVGAHVGDRFHLLILKNNKLSASSGYDPEIGLRKVLSQVQTEEEYCLVSRAAQICTWYHSFRFCPRCATHLTCHDNELAKVCGGCGHHQYPRISPCIIVLVRNGDKCLLAHASRFATGRYSTLAGFIEAGESAEMAVKREVQEEVGIEIDNVEYCFSQSWPFPHSLMLGYVADYKGGEIVPDGDEILLADWFSVHDLPVLPPRFTIARRLIDRFLAEQGESVEQSALFFPAE